MNDYFRAFLHYTAGCFLLLFVLAFTPFAWLPGLLSLVTEGWVGILIILGIGGAPCAGYLMLWIVSPCGKYLQEASKLTGMWIASIVGDVLGTYLAGVR